MVFLPCVVYGPDRDTVTGPARTSDWLSTDLRTTLFTHQPIFIFTSSARRLLLITLLLTLRVLLIDVTACCLSVDRFHSVSDSSRPTQTAERLFRLNCNKQQVSFSCGGIACFSPTNWSRDARCCLAKSCDQNTSDRCWNQGCSRAGTYKCTCRHYYKCLICIFFLFLVSIYPLIMYLLSVKSWWIMMHITVDGASHCLAGQSQDG